MAQSPELANSILQVLAQQESFGSVLKGRIANFQSDHSQIDTGQLMLMIGYVGKGRFARQLSDNIGNAKPPAYIQDAIAYVVGKL